MNRLDAIVYRLARATARRRGSRPALHPRGVVLTGRLTVPGPPPPWGVPWLDRPGSYRVTARWSRAAGLPYPLPDGLGLALRVEDAEGPGRPLELLLTTCGRSRPARHVPVLRLSATAGPYSTLLGYAVGDRHGVVAAFPMPGTPGVPAHPGAVAAAVAVRPLRFVLGFAADRRWEPMARLTLLGEEQAVAGEAFDPYRTPLTAFRPSGRLRGLRVAAYAGSREGRAGRRPGPIGTRDHGPDRDAGGEPGAR
ncbi:phosphodiesterase [Streptomyces sp. NPDC004266]|uniref:phosphodiesterase n=1 Tax=Streptomyces sp. NPDC004266 TaxID=3364693 RepID=UPI00367866AA